MWMFPGSGGRNDAQTGCRQTAIDCQQFVQRLTPFQVQVLFCRQERLLLIYEIASVSKN